MFKKTSWGNYPFLSQLPLKSWKIWTKLKSFQSKNIQKQILETNFGNLYSKGVSNLKDNNLYWKEIKKQKSPWSQMKKCHGCRFCEDTFTHKESAMRHEKTFHLSWLNKSKIPDQTKLHKQLKNNGNYDCKINWKRICKETWKNLS